MSTLTYQWYSLARPCATEGDLQALDAKVEEISDSVKTNDVFPLTSIALLGRANSIEQAQVSQFFTEQKLSEIGNLSFETQLISIFVLAKLIDSQTIATSITAALAIDTCFYPSTTRRFIVAQALGSKANDMLVSGRSLKQAESDSSAFPSILWKEIEADPAAAVKNLKKSWMAGQKSWDSQRELIRRLEEKSQIFQWLTNEIQAASVSGLTLGWTSDKVVETAIFLASKLETFPPPQYIYSIIDQMDAFWGANKKSIQLSQITEDITPKFRDHLKSIVESCPQSHFCPLTGFIAGIEPIIPTIGLTTIIEDQLPNLELTFKQFLIQIFKEIYFLNKHK